MSLPGPSRTITVEPLEAPEKAPAPPAGPGRREPDRQEPGPSPAPERRPEPARDPDEVPA